jgi:galactokinase
MKVRLNKNEPTAIQRRALKKEVTKEFNNLLERYNYDTALQVLHILHFDFGFGQARLQKFADRLTEMQINQRERYELTDNETPWLCENQLKADGINLDTLIKE